MDENYLFIPPPLTPSHLRSPPASDPFFSPLSTLSFYEAARALEECDPAFKPVFASKPTKGGPTANPAQSGSDYGGGPGFNGSTMGGGMNMASMWQSMASQFMSNMGQQPQQQQQSSNSLPTPPSIQVQACFLSFFFKIPRLCTRFLVVS